MPDAQNRKEERVQPGERAPSFDTTTREHAPVRENEPQREGQKDIAREEGRLDEAIDGLKKKLRKPKKQKPTQIPQVRDELTVKVEKIMEEGLHDAYMELSPVEKQEFKIKGEETARQIRELLKATHVKIKKIFKLLFDWLKLLPGINRFYLEQESKIKADKIVALHDTYHPKKR